MVALPPTAAFSDLTVEASIEQARYELDRAGTDNERLAEWARRWGQSAIEAMHVMAPAVDEDAPGKLEDAEREIDGLKEENGDLEKRIAELETENDQLAQQLINLEKERDELLAAQEAAQ